MGNTDHLKNIYIVLLEPKNPGNIGSVARAMKNMGIEHLRLINPVDYKKSVEQKKMGYRSQDIIVKSQEFSALDEAMKDISMVFLATARPGKWKKDFLSPQQSASIMSETIPKQKIAVIFGREDSGVTIDESQQANYFIKIPSAVSYPSLNLSQAVMVVVYEIYKAVIRRDQITSLPRIAPRRSFERLVNNIWGLMKELRMREPEDGLFHRSLRRAINRTRWTNADIAVFDRACKQVRWFIERNGQIDLKGKE